MGLYTQGVALVWDWVAPLGLKADAHIFFHEKFIKVVNP